MKSSCYESVPNTNYAGIILLYMVVLMSGKNSRHQNTTYIRGIKRGS